MKEWCLKHPVLTFILVDLAAYNLFVVINNAVKASAIRKTVTVEELTEENNNDEHTGDIQ